jgi:transposase-like protein
MNNSGPTSIKEKILIVCQVIAGENIQRVARKHGVSRPSVCAWTEESFKYLEQALKPAKRGPKCKKGRVDAKDKVVEK